MDDLQPEVIDGATHIGIKGALRQLLEKLEKLFDGGDPLPGFSNENDPFGRSAFDVKLNFRARLELFAALLKGHLSAKAVTAGRHKILPRWAWARPGYVQHCALDGKLRLSPLLPDEWQDWTCLPIFIDCAEFDAWACTLKASDPVPADVCGTGGEVVEGPAFVTERALRQVAMVSLAEAATWVAFYIAIESYELDLIEEAGEVTDIVSPRFPSAAKGVVAMLEAGSGLSPKLAIFGRHTENLFNDSGVSDVKAIPPVDLASYREPIWHRNALRWAPRYDSAANHHPLSELFNERSDAWHDVRVDRAQLLSVFPPRPRSQAGGEKKVPANRKLNYEELIAQAVAMRDDRPSITIGSAAASIVQDLPRNPKSGKLRDARGIERIIAPVWNGGKSQSPR